MRLSVEPLVAPKVLLRALTDTQLQTTIHGSSGNYLISIGNPFRCRKPIPSIPLGIGQSLNKPKKYRRTGFVGQTAG